MTLLPQEMSPITRAFPANALDFMPPEDEIPDEFRDDRNQAVRVVRYWLFEGWSAEVAFHPRPGIDAEAAFWHIQCIAGSYAPRYEHKEAAMAYLAALWFVRVVDGVQEWTLVEPA